jgi:hypothetical protein
LHISRLLDRTRREAHDNGIGLPYGGGDFQFPVLAAE